MSEARRRMDEHIYGAENARCIQYYREVEERRWNIIHERGYMVYEDNDFFGWLATHLEYWRLKHLEKLAREAMLRATGVIAMYRAARIRWSPLAAVRRVIERTADAHLNEGG